MKTIEESNEDSEHGSNNFHENKLCKTKLNSKDKEIRKDYISEIMSRTYTKQEELSEALNFPDKSDIENLYSNKNSPDLESQDVPDNQNITRHESNQNLINDESAENESTENMVYNYESDEDLDIPTEENFLKSSTSASGEDDILDCSSNFGRPRSVHFEDERWENGQYVPDDEGGHLIPWKSDHCLDSSTDSGQAETWNESLKSARSDLFLHEQGILKSAKKISPIEKKATGKPFSGSMRLHNVKSASKESVREILRKRREEMGDTIEHNSRRRIKSISNSDSRRRSKSRDNGYLDPLNRDKINENKLRKSQSMWDCSDDGLGLDILSARSIKDQKLSDYRYKTPYLSPGINLNIISNYSDGAVISKKDYHLFRSLAGANQTNTIKDRRQTYPTVKQYKKNTNIKKGKPKR